MNGALTACSLKTRRARTRMVRAAIAGGARRLGMIAGPETVQTARERRAGFLRALAESGLAPAAIVPGDYTVEGGNAGMRALLDAGVDAVFAREPRADGGGVEPPGSARGERARIGL